MATVNAFDIRSATSPQPRCSLPMPVHVPRCHKHRKCRFHWERQSQGAAMGTKACASLNMFHASITRHEADIVPTRAQNPLYPRTFKYARPERGLARISLAQRRNKGVVASKTSITLSFRGPPPAIHQTSRLASAFLAKRPAGWLPHHRSPATGAAAKGWRIARHSAAVVRRATCTATVGTCFDHGGQPAQIGPRKEKEQLRRRD